MLMEGQRDGRTWVGVEMLSHLKININFLILLSLFNTKMHSERPSQDLAQQNQ